MKDTEQVRIVGVRVLTADADTCAADCVYYSSHALFCVLFDERLDMVEGRPKRCHMCRTEEIKDDQGRTSSEEG